MLKEVRDTIVFLGLPSAASINPHAHSAGVPVLGFRGNAETIGQSILKSWPGGPEGFLEDWTCVPEDGR